MRLRSCLVSSIILTLFSFAGCVGDDPTSGPGADNDASVGTGDSSIGEGGSGSDVNACTPECSSATTLHTCGGPDQTCALGCISAGTAHCGVIQPSGPVTVGNLTDSAVSDLVATASTVLHTDTGAIDGIRTANVGDPSSYQVISNIGFALFPGSHVGVFVFKNFTINDKIVVTARGTAAVAIVAGDSVSIQGILDARGTDSSGFLCTAGAGSIGPGGTAAGDATGTSGVGSGGGNGADVGGGGGGGFGGVGGNGAAGSGESPPFSAGGSVVPFAVPITGGFGGGTSGGGNGGGGGGGVQIVAAHQIQIGGGTQPGGINVGGCGGFGGTDNEIPGQGGGGGGSGGEIFLQSPVVDMLGSGVLAANGGAGGSGGGLGVAGLLSDQPALPAPVNGTTTKGPGGGGSAAATLVGANAPSVPSGTLGGGGGGAAGRIRIDNATGVAPILASGAIASPSLGSAAVTVTKVTGI